MNSAKPCQGDPDLWFSRNPRDRDLAAYLCQRGQPTGGPCPALGECFEAAVLNGERFGIWGGRSQEELQAHTAGMRCRKVVAQIPA